MSVRDDLIAAKALIDMPEKWIKGWYDDENGHLCALGAVNKAISGSTQIEDKSGPIKCRLISARLALEAVLPRYWKMDGVAAFNDSDRRKHVDIMALFDRAIEAAK